MSQNKIKFTSDKCKGYLGQYYINTDIVHGPTEIIKVFLGDNVLNPNTDGNCSGANLN